MNLFEWFWKTPSDQSQFTTKARSVEFLLPYDKSAYDKFHTDLHNWIHSSKQVVSGLPGPGYIVNGVTEALDQTYALYNKIGIFEGEYGYHELALPSTRLTYNLDEADCIIVSHPFSANGMSAHDNLKDANTYNKPIFVDCAFFGICMNQSFDFSRYKNIHSVAFSLSKVFGTGWHRVGMLYTKDPYPVTVTTAWSYEQLATAEKHYGLLSKVGPDDIPKYYRSSQLKICKRNKLTPSDTVIFGIDYNNIYDKQFERGDSNRICISKILENNNKSFFTKVGILTK